LPAVLGLLGRKVNRLALPFLRRTVERPDPDKGFWARWAQGVMHRPVRWTILAILLLLVFAAPVIQLNLGLDLGTNSLRNRSSGQAVIVLQRSFSPGAVSPIQIVVEDPRGALSDQDLQLVAQLTADLQHNRDILSVVSVTSALDQIAGNHSAATLSALEALPQAKQDLSYLVNLGQGNTTTIINVVSRSATDSNTAMALVRSIRQTVIPQVKGNADVTILVGGLSAQIVDLSTESSQKLPLVVAGVLLLSFLLLTLVFRSLFLPLKAILMNTFSVLAAYGLLVVVFQQGAGAGVFNFTPVGNIQVYLPLLTFAFLFGLSMDYEVFLIGRMKEEWEQTQVNERAVARGLQHTARAITSAAAIMVAVFISFAFTTMLEVKEMGFALAVAVFVDATVIRVLLVPTAMRLLGNWNWWLPRWLDRLLPRIDLGENPGAVSPPPAPGSSPTTGNNLPGIKTGT
jgi:RND superfamily putative drug exporter